MLLQILEEKFTQSLSQIILESICLVPVMFLAIVTVYNGNLHFVSISRETQEKSIDLNLKVYKNLDFGKFGVVCLIEEVLMEPNL
jgi:hypothetical protein